MPAFVLNTNPLFDGKRVSSFRDNLATIKVRLGNKFIECKHVMQLFPNPILITSRDIKIIYVNPSWEKLTGYTLAEVEGKNPSLLKSDKTPPKIYEKMWKQLNAGKQFSSDNIINKRKSGEDYQIDTTIFPVKQGNEIIFFVQVEQDITQRKRLEELKKQFLQTATHELKTPIAALKLLIELQVRKIKKLSISPDIVKSLQLIDHELDRLTRLVNELADVARIESGKLKMNMRVIDLSYLIMEVVEQMQTLSKGHKLNYKRSNPVMILADADRMKQVLINLMNNAIKFSPQNKDINIGLQVKKDQVTVAIADKGLGIQKKQIPFIFNRYYQIEKGSHFGFGLGLYIAREIIKRHKGTIWVKSRLHKGSTFYFTIRICQ